MSIKLSFVTKLLIIFFILTINYKTFPFSLTTFKENFKDETTNYYVKLNNGDVISGNIIATINSIQELNAFLGNNTENSIPTTEKFIPFIIINTFEEEIFVYEDEIMTINERKNNINTFQEQSHSYFLLPTANPIANKHSIGNYEIFFLYGGIGILDILSVSAGYSFIPFTTTSDQITIINTKFSTPAIKLQNVSANINFAAGINYAQVNNNNKLIHIFGLATYNFISPNPANATIGIFYKAGKQDFPSTARLFGYEFPFNYVDGAFGITGGFEKHLNTRKDLSLLFEIWNADIVNAANTAIMLGFRLSGKNLYADFGLSVFTIPFVAPFFSFVWMPFAN